MLKKALITAVLIVIAMASNGARPAAALSFLMPQDLRPVTGDVNSVDSSIATDSGEEFREEFHQTYPLSATGRVGVENKNGGRQNKVWDGGGVKVDEKKKAWPKKPPPGAQIK